MELSLMAVPSVARPVPVQPFVSVLLPIVLRTVRVVMVDPELLIPIPYYTSTAEEAAVQPLQAVAGFIVILPVHRLLNTVRLQAVLSSQTAVTAVMAVLTIRLWPAESVAMAVMRW
ncbi:MAG: hypothetical protein ACYSO4_09165, partial [Planctomycetota bacterium]|jgi:hypothetical protein